jgi:hypothetical protein
MNSCPQTEKIVHYCLDELAGKEKEFFEIHLRSCEICQRELQVEKVIESELSAEFDPGFIESKIRIRLQLWQAQDARSFWLYAFRMVVYGITAAIAGFVLIPMLVKLLTGSFPNLSQYTHGMADLLGRLAPGNLFLMVLGFCYIAVFIASIYSLAQIRR